MTRACAAAPGHKETKQKIGTLRLPVEEVVRNNKIRDSWALQVALPYPILNLLFALPVEEIVRNSKIRDSWALQAR